MKWPKSKYRGSGRKPIAATAAGDDQPFERCRTRAFELFQSRGSSARREPAPGQHARKSCEPPWPRAPGAIDSRLVRRADAGTFRSYAQGREHPISLLRTDGISRFSRSRPHRRRSSVRSRRPSVACSQITTRGLSSGYRVPESACPTYRALYHGLEEFERDLYHHVHLENNILFPRALHIEQRVSEAANERH